MILPIGNSPLSVSGAVIPSQVPRPSCELGNLTRSFPANQQLVNASLLTPLMDNVGCNPLTNHHQQQQQHHPWPSSGQRTTTRNAVFCIFMHQQPKSTGIVLFVYQEKKGHWRCSDLCRNFPSQHLFICLFADLLLDHVFVGILIPCTATMMTR